MTYVNTGDELLYPNVKESYEKDQEVSAQGFFAWCRDIKDPNYKYEIRAFKFDTTFLKNS
jgi:hypothetical protein